MMMGSMVDAFKDGRLHSFLIFYVLNLIVKKVMIEPIAFLGSLVIWVTSGHESLSEGNTYH